jgi:hypothetical protein
MRHLGQQLAPALLVLAELENIGGDIVLVDLLNDAGGVNFAPSTVSAVVGPTPSQNDPILADDMAPTYDGIRVAAVGGSCPCDAHCDQRNYGLLGAGRGSEFDRHCSPTMETKSAPDVRPYGNAVLLRFPVKLQTDLKMLKGAIIVGEVTAGGASGRYTVCDFKENPSISNGESSVRMRFGTSRRRTVQSGVVI